MSWFLTEKEKEILVLLVEEGTLTYREIADEIDCSESYVRKKYKRITGEYPKNKKKGRRL